MRDKKPFLPPVMSVRTSAPSQRPPCRSHGTTSGFACSHHGLILAEILLLAPLSVGFDQLTRFAVMSGGKRARHKMGASSLAPEPELVNLGMSVKERHSQPCLGQRRWPCRGVATSSASREGRLVMLYVNHRKSSRASWTPRLRWPRASWSCSPSVNVGRTPSLGMSSGRTHTR
jgi:hypothetical protein